MKAEAEWRIMIYDDSLTEIGDMVEEVREKIEEECENGSFC